MLADEIIELNDVGEVLDGLTDPMIELLLPEQAAVLSLAHAALKIPGTIKDYCLYQKFHHFLVAIRNNDLQDSVKFSSQLFNDEKTARENALRLIQYIDKAETLTVVDYMVNASRSAGNGLITESDYYRILWVLANAYPDDLHYFRSIAASEGSVQGNTRVIALAQFGLLITEGIDRNRSIENQDYRVTSLGMMVDKYALSLNDEERWEYWKNCERKRQVPKPKTNLTSVEGDTLIMP